MQTETLSLIKNDHMLVQYLPQQMVKVLTRYHQQTLHVGKDIGKGKVYVLLHGIESSSSYWANFANVLSKKYRVITLDLVGFGRSPKPLNIGYTLDDQVAWLKRTLDELGIEKCSIIGHSLGALVAYKYAAIHPKQVDNLVLVSPVFIGASNASKRLIIRRFNYINYFSDEGYLVSTVAKAVGQKKLDKFTPTIRSVNNAVKNQESPRLATKINSSKMEIIYGQDDMLVDQAQVKAISSWIPRARITVVKGGHNFALNQPQVLMNAVDKGLSKDKIKNTSFKPKQILRQLVKLAAPALFAKGSFYLISGLLLFSQYREEVLVAGVVGLVMVQSAQFIRGSFSLKNEGLSYLGYIGLGIFGIVTGYLLSSHFNFTLWLSLAVVCVYVFVNGFTRVFSSLYVNKDKALKRKLFISGSLYVLASITAISGSLVSVYAIMYTLAAYLIIRGLSYLMYLGITFLSAFARSF